MYDIRRIGANFKPAIAGAWPYFDRAVAWLRDPADRRTVDALREHCGHLHDDNRRARFDSTFVQRLEFKQPGVEVFRWLACRDDAFINGLEVAIDWTFNFVDEVEDAEEFLRQHLIRKWHRRQPIRVRGRTLYDGPRRARNLIARYGDRHSRITGEVHCLHVEWRANGVAAVRRAGVHSGRDLMHFGHRRFWKRRMVLLDVDVERLGRSVRNRRNGGRSRTPMLRQCRWNGRTVNVDEWTGTTLLNSVGSVQELVDSLGFVRGVFSRLPVDGWLPAAESGGNADLSSSSQRVARGMSVLAGNHR